MMIHTDAFLPDPQMVGATEVQILLIFIQVRDVHLRGIKMKYVFPFLN